MSEPYIRSVQLSDVGQFIELCTEHAAYERASIERPSESRLREALFGDPPRLHAWVARCGSELVGYASATIDFSTWGMREFVHMDCLYVRERQRRFGIGRRLVEAVVKRAAELNIGELQWQTPEWNVEAQRFYERLGASSARKVRFSFEQKGESGPP